MKAVSQSTLSKRPRQERAVYSLNELANLLGRSYTATHEAALAGTLPVKGFKVGRAWRFPKAEVDRLLGRGETGGGEPV
jgi:predicted site-specific integrase-resolvase